MKSMGVSHKEQYPQVDMPAKGEYENETSYPEMTVSGKHALMLGADKLEDGDTVKIVGEYEVKRHRLTSENGEDRYEMTLCLKKADVEKGEASEDESDDSGDTEDEDESESPALSYLHKMAGGG